MDNFYTNEYLRRLLIESPYIRAKLLNPGGSVILTGTAADTEQPQDYSSQIGSGFHLDLVEAEIKFDELPQEQKEALLAWALGVSAKEASMYFAATGVVLRKRRERGVDTLTKKMNDERRPNPAAPRVTRGNSRPDSERRYRRVT